MILFLQWYIHSGITEEHIINYMNQFKKEEKKVYIFKIRIFFIINNNHFKKYLYIYSLKIIS